MPDVPELSASSLYKRGNFVFEEFLTQVPAMADCLRLARSACKCDLSVLITGESGVGKNLLAQAIHNASARAKGPFVAINMSSLSEQLVQSELFGHEKGAFTGADKQHKGKFELADAGTLVLDEIGDMSLAAQPKILHAVEYKHFHRVGGETTIRSDARIISVTNRDLDELVGSQRFRSDLLYRLRDITIEIPPLRERRADIGIIAARLLGQYKESLRGRTPGFSEEARSALQAYDWPGNVRELKAAVRRAVVLAMGETIAPEHLGLGAESPAEEPTASDPAQDRILSLAELEREHILRTLGALDNNKRQTAKALGISRSTLDRKLQKLHMHTDPSQAG